MENNWPIHAGKRPMREELGDWQLFLNVFWRHSMRSSLMSITGCAPWASCVSVVRQCWPTWPSRAAEAEVKRVLGAECRCGLVLKEGERLPAYSSVKGSEA